MFVLNSILSEMGKVTFKPTYVDCTWQEKQL